MTSMHRSLQAAVARYFIMFTIYKGVYKGGGKGVFKGGAVQPLKFTPEIFRFFLKSERKEVERKRKK